MKFLAMTTFLKEKNAELNMKAELPGWAQSPLHEDQCYIPGDTLFAHQREGANFILEQFARSRNVILGDEMV
jgi:hypothetical protein